jgi:hypothetical protein
MRFTLTLISILALTGCAYVGDPLPPALKIPSPVTDLAARQVGPDLLISFTIPKKTMEGLELKTLGGIDLKIGPSPSQPFNPDVWSGSARSIPATAIAPAKIETKVPARDWANQEVILGVRMANSKRRVSPWSNFVTLKVVGPLDKPAQLRAIATPAGVQLDWVQPNPRPAISWTLFRKTSADAEPVEVATVKTPNFTDIGTSYDTTYQYSVQALEDTAISEASDPLAITPVDTFPPLAPLGLSALAGPNAVQLSWERNRETDLAAYRIYRASANGGFTKIAESPTAASYRDAAISTGQTYRYQITAIDRKGNESPKSSQIEILIP